MVTKAYLGGARNSEHYEIILLQVVHRLRCLSNCCQRQGGPIEAVDVLSDQSRIALNDELQNFPLVQLHLVHPCVCVEPDGKADGEEDTSVPVDEDEDVKDNLCDPERVWKVGPGLGLIKKLEHPVYPGHPVQPEDDRAGHLLRALALEEEVGKIGGQDAQHVQLKPPALSVVLSQHGGLLDHDALVQVALVHPHQKVEKVDCVADVVDNQPTL